MRRTSWATAASRYRVRQMPSASRRLVGAFFLGWVIVYAGRAILPPVLSTIGAEFQVSATQLGLLGSAFYLTYAALQIPVGLAAEHVGRKRLLVWGFASFGLTTALSGLAPTFWILVLFIALTGIGQGTYYSTQYSIAAESAPPGRRAFHLALINSGMAVGVGGGATVASWMSFGLGLGWRVPLIVVGLLTLVTAALLQKLVSEPERESDPQAGKTRLGRSEMLHRNQVAAYVASFCSVYAFFTLLTWLPYYLERFRGFGTLSAGLLLSIVAWVSVPAALAFSRLSDRYGIRRRLLILMLPVASLAMIVLMMSRGFVPVVLGLTLYGLSGKLSTDPLLIAYVAETSAPRTYSATLGVFNFAGMLGSVGAPIVTGAVVTATGNMVAALMIPAGLLLVATAVLLLFGREDRVFERIP